MASRRNVRVVAGVAGVFLVSDSESGGKKVKVRVLQHNSEVVWNGQIPGDRLSQCPKHARRRYAVVINLAVSALHAGLVIILTSHFSQ